MVVVVAPAVLVYPSVSSPPGSVAVDTVPSCCTVTGQTDDEFAAIAVLVVVAVAVVVVDFDVITDAGTMFRSDVGVDALDAPEGRDESAGKELEEEEDDDDDKTGTVLLTEVTGSARNPPLPSDITSIGTPGGIQAKEA